MADPAADPSPPVPPHGSRRVDAHPLLGHRPPAAAVGFAFADRPLTGRAGEPVLAALLAAGVRVCRTMPGSGEARGGFCLVGRCTDCLMEVDGEPNVRTCVTPLRAEMQVATQIGLGRQRGGTAAASADGADGDAP